MRSINHIMSLVLFLLSHYLSSAYTATKPNVVQKALLRLGRGKKLREEVVDRYFDGVRQQSPEQIISCFPQSTGTVIRDVCGISNSEKLATSDQLGDRCMEFLAAHPDTKVMFYYPPTCGRGKTRWVFAHWYEEGTWKGKAQGIEPENTPLNVEGQTRFLVNDDLKITKMVVTRTFSDWEKKLQERQQQQKQRF